MNGQTLEEVDQLKYLGSAQTKDGTSVKQVMPDQPGAGPLSCDKETVETVEKQSHQFSHKGYTLQVTCLVGASLCRAGR